jgi:hypothetical protein
MNIFYLHDNPIICAQYHCDIHCNKMLIESVQLLSNTLNYLDIHAPYKMTHKNHPCSKWVRTSSQNYTWLWSLADALGIEFYKRYGHWHKCFIILLDHIPPILEQLPSVGLTDRPNCTPYKNLNPLEAYRKYYITEKSRFAKWKLNNIPDWYVLGLRSKSSAYTHASQHT